MVDIGPVSSSGGPRYSPKGTYMKTEFKTADVPEEASGAGRLRSNSIGPIGLAALAIGILSPALGLYA